MNRDAIKVKCDTLGVEFCRHRDSARMQVAGWFHYLRGNPWFAQSVYVTWHPHIFVPDGVGDPLEDWQLIDHELVHFVQQREYGATRWVLRYLTSPRFRADQERPAFLRDIKNGRLTLKQAAERLHGPLYQLDEPPQATEAWFRAELAVRVPRRPSDGV